MPRAHADPITLTPEERAELERRVRGTKTPQRDVFRARILLLAAAGRSNRQIAIELKTPRETAIKWRRRYLKHGLDGLDDAPRSGRPPTVSPSGEGEHRRSRVRSTAGAR